MDAEAVARKWIELYNKVEPGTYGGTEFFELYSDNCTWREMPTPHTPEGRFSQGPIDIDMTFQNAALRDRHAELQELVASENHAAMRYEWTAIVKASAGPEGPQLPPPGTVLRAQVGAFLTVADGKITEITEISSIGHGFLADGS